MATDTIEAGPGKVTANAWITNLIAFVATLIETELPA